MTISDYFCKFVLFFYWEFIELFKHEKFRNYYSLFAAIAGTTIGKFLPFMPIHGFLGKLISGIIVFVGLWIAFCLLLTIIFFLIASAIRQDEKDQLVKADASSARE
jgi:putative Mn2+ efflux pump MntP